MGDSLDKGSFFATVKFSGDRFRGGNLPVELLDNIKSYQEILILLAQEIWKEKNPDKTRLPKNFNKHLSLSFSHVSDGSAAAVLKSDSSIELDLLPTEDSLSYLELAQSRFFEFSNAANENKKILGVPPRTKVPLQKLLSDFQPSERLEFISHLAADQKLPSVRFSTKTRDNLLDSAKDSAFQNVSGIGIIRSILDGSEQIGILSEHGSFNFPVSRDRIRSEEFRIADFVEFSIFASLGSNGQVKRIEESLSLEVVSKNREYERLKERLSEIGNLRDGWKYGAGKKINSIALRFAEDLSGFICSIYEQVSAFPETDGSVNLEFSTRGVEVLVMCKGDYVRLEAYDDSDDDPSEQVYFGLSPKLLKNLSDIESFMS